MEKILCDLSAVKKLYFYKVKNENIWRFGGVNKHLFRKVNLIIRAQFLLCRLHNSDSLKLYESFRRQTLLYYSFFWTLILQRLQNLVFQLLTCSAKWHVCCAKRLKWQFGGWILVSIRFARITCVAVFFIELQKNLQCFCTSRDIFLTL